MHILPFAMTVGGLLVYIHLANSSIVVFVQLREVRQQRIENLQELIEFVECRRNNKVRPPGRSSLHL